MSVCEGREGAAIIVRLVRISCESEAGQAFDTYEVWLPADKLVGQDALSFVEIVSSQGFGAAVAAMRIPEIKLVGRGGAKRLRVRCLRPGSDMGGDEAVGIGEGVEFEVYASGKGSA